MSGAERPSGPAGRTVGVVMAAGGGSRYGLPKALVVDERGEPWVAGIATTLLAAGCRPVLAVVGARADEVVRLLPDQVVAVPCRDWRSGMAASLGEGLRAASEVPGVVRVVVVPVDTPGLTVAAVRRVLDVAGSSPEALVRAVYHGVPGHPVVFGAGHLGAALATLTGDDGARAYLDAQGAERVECADIARGDDIDTPEDRAVWRGMPAATGEDTGRS